MKANNNDKETRFDTLTDLGRSLKPILDAMQSWGEAYKAKSEA